MLNKIKLAFRYFFIRILLVLIIFTFIFFYIKDIFIAKKYNKDTLINFSIADNITKGEFIRERNILFNTNLIENHDQRIVNYVNNVTLSHLIHAKMIDSIIKDNKLCINDELFFKLIDKISLLHDEDHNFSQEKFDTLGKLFVYKRDYIEYLKSLILRDMFNDIFIKSIIIPDFLIKNVYSYLFEKRTVDIFSIDLNFKDDSYKISYDDDLLLKFYKKHEELFKIPERRSFKFIHIKKENLLEQLQKEKDIYDFYLTNLSLFNNKPFDEVKDLVINQISEKKIVDFRLNFIQKLQDDIKNISLEEISSNNNLSCIDINEITFQELLNNNLSVCKRISNIVFDSKLGSHLYELDDGSIVLFNLVNITNSILKDFESCKDVLSKLYIDNCIKKLNIVRLKEFANNFHTNKALKKGIIITNGIEFVRSDIQQNNNLSNSLVSNIFKTRLGSITPIVKDKNQQKAYFASVKKIEFDSNTFQNLENNFKHGIIEEFRNFIVGDLITFLIKKNNMQINIAKP